MPILPRWTLSLNASRVRVFGLATSKTRDVFLTPFASCDTLDAAPSWTPGEAILLGVPVCPRGPNQRIAARFGSVRDSPRRLALRRSHHGRESKSTTCVRRKWPQNASL